MISVSLVPLAANSWLQACENWKESQSFPWRSRLSCLLSTSGMIHRHVKVVAHLDNDCQPTSFAMVDIPPRTSPLGWRTAWISNVWTKPEARGLGHAHAVVLGAIEVAALNHAEEVRLYTSRNTAECNLYADCQFEFIPNVNFLMRNKFEKSFIPPPDCSSLSGTRFEVGPDDLSLIGSILSRQHFILSDRGFLKAGDQDAEETFCQMIDRGYDLGVVLFWRDKVLSPWLCWLFWDEQGNLGVRLSGEQNVNWNDSEISETGVMSIIHSVRQGRREEYLPPRM